PHRLFLVDQGLDLAVLNRLELFRGDLVLLSFCARALERRRPQQAADMIGAEGRFSSLHQISLVLQFFDSSCRTIFAPFAIACILPKATSRGRYFMPQSGATTIRCAGMKGKARRMRSATVSAVSTATSDRSITPSTMVFPGSSLS